MNHRSFGLPMLFLAGYYFGLKQEGREVESTRTAEITDRPGDFARTIDPIDPSLQSPTQPRGGSHEYVGFDIQGACRM